MVQAIAGNAHKFTKKFQEEMKAENREREGTQCVLQSLQLVLISALLP